MTKHSWIVTLIPLVIAIGQTLRTFLTGEPLTEQEIELIKYLVTAFIGSGAIGGAVAVLKRKNGHIPKDMKNIVDHEVNETLRKHGYIKSK